VISATAFYLFLMHSLFASRPFLDLKLLTNRNYAIGLALIMLFGMLNFTPMVLLPTLMRGQMGFPDSLVGQVVGARGLGGLAGFFAVMFLARIDPRISVATGFGLLAFAGVWLMRIDLNVSALELSLNGIVQGLAAGIIVVALTLTTFTGMSREKMAEATAVYHLIRNIGASLFISVCVAEVVRSTGFNYARLAELVSPYNRAFAGPAVDTLFDVTSAIGLERISREISKQSAMIAYINAFGLFTAAAAVAMPLIMFLQRPTPGRS
jgi:DHA2 family multidrug resistance protein